MKGDEEQEEEEEEEAEGHGLKCGKQIRPRSLRLDSAHQP
jgi:hypothetical protein